MTRLQQRIKNFKKAFDIFSKAVDAYKNNKINILNHMALIQSFEICFELSWKVLKDFLYEKGIEKHFPKEVIKEAFSTEIIKNGELWIDMLNDRNSSSHEYDMQKINAVLERIASIYYVELLAFKDWALLNE